MTTPLFPSVIAWNVLDGGTDAQDGNNYPGPALQDYAAAVVGAAGVPGYTAPLVQTGTYIGTGAAQSVALSFTPDLVMLIPENAISVVFKHRFTWRNTSPQMGVAVSHASSVLLFSDAQFSVAAAYSTVGIRYHWIALADNGSGQLYCGSYAGNGVDGRLIEVGFKPVFVAIKRDNVFPCWIRADGHTTSYPLSAAASANNIKSLADTGFTIGTAADVNSASDAAGSGGESYDFFALAPSLAWRVQNFVGNNAARTISTIAGFNAALVKSLDSGTPRAARMVTSTMASGADKPIGNTALAAGVMTKSGDSLLLAASAEVNGSGVQATVLSFAENTGVRARSEIRAALPALRIDSGGGVVCATNNAAFNLVSTSPISLEVLAQFDGAAGASRAILGRTQDAAGGNSQYLLALTSANQSLVVIFSLGGGTQKVLEYGLTFLEDRPYHLIFTFDGTADVALYVDGKLAKAASSTVAVGNVVTPVNAKFAIGCLRSTSDSRDWSSVNDAYALARLYNVELTASQAAARYRRAVLRDYSAADVVPLEEWDADNIVGATWYATYSATNNGTIASGTIVSV